MEKLCCECNGDYLDEKKKKVAYENFGEFFIVMIKFIDFSLF